MCARECREGEKHTANRESHLRRMGGCCLLLVYVYVFLVFMHYFRANQTCLPFVKSLELSFVIETSEDP